MAGRLAALSQAGLFCLPAQPHLLSSSALGATCSLHRKLPCCHPAEAARVLETTPSSPQRAQEAEGPALQLWGDSTWDEAPVVHGRPSSSGSHSPVKAPAEFFVSLLASDCRGKPGMPFTAHPVRSRNFLAVHAQP